MEKTLIMNDVKYKLVEHLTLGSVKDDFVAIEGETITAFNGIGIAEFIEYNYEYLTSPEGVDAEKLAEINSVDVLELQDFLSGLEENGILYEIPNLQNEIPPIVFQTYQRGRRQVSIQEIMKQFESTTVHLHSNTKNPLSDSIINSLKDVGVNVSDKEQITLENPPEFRIVVASSLIDPILDSANLQSLEDKVPWISVLPFDGRNAWVGPFVIPNKSACITCFKLRRSANFADDVFRSELLKLTPLEKVNKPIYHSPINLIQSGLVTNIISEWIGLGKMSPSSIPGGFKTISLDNRGISMDSHRVLRVPRCPDCSPAAGTGYPQVWFHGEKKGSEK